MKRVSFQKVSDLLKTAKRASDMEFEELQFLSDAFQDAHEAAPGGLSIEVGTRKGGSAWLMLSMLREMYGDERPMLFTVDPYGDRPYPQGDALYGRNEYKAARTWLAEFPEHAHFYLTAKTFFYALIGQPYYLRGKEELIERFTFVLLDGEHTAEAIGSELSTVMPHMRRGGAILIDNVDKDPKARAKIDEVVDDIQRGFPGPWVVTNQGATTPGAAQTLVRLRE